MSEDKGMDGPTLGGAGAKGRVVSWFSCGTASAVNTKLAIAKYAATHDVTVARCIVPEEDKDNDRFAADCERWFGMPVTNLKSTEYESCEDVWTRTRYMAGVGGARCTVEMKKAVRHAFEPSWDAIQLFGFTEEERSRARRFERQNPEVRLESLLLENHLSKDDCHAIVARAGIALPRMYAMGFPNANCIGCVAAQSPGYWARVRAYFPEVFKRRAALSRLLGVRLVKGTSGARERIFLDELPIETPFDSDEPSVECSLLCQIAESLTADGAPAATQAAPKSSSKEDDR